MNITATITARGAASTVPANDTAVDATIVVDGITVGEVTLLIGDDTERPDLDKWGDLDHWASWQLIEWFRLVEVDFESNHGDDPHDAVVNAVRAADGVARLTAAANNLGEAVEDATAAFASFAKAAEAPDAVS